MKHLLAICWGVSGAIYIWFNLRHKKLGRMQSGLWILYEDAERRASYLTSLSVSLHLLSGNGDAYRLAVRTSEMIQVGCWAQCLACNKWGICGIAYFYYPRSQSSLKTRFPSFQAHTFPPYVSASKVHGRLHGRTEVCTLEAESIAGLWLDAWGATVN